MKNRKKQQITHLVREAVSYVFLHHKQTYLGNAFVTVTEVSLSPDFLQARIFIAVLQKEMLPNVLNNLKTHHKGIRGLVGNYLKNKVRRIPELTFLEDTTLEKAVELENIFKELRKGNKGRS